MKISNKLFNEQQLGQFSKNMEKIQKIQDKISSGKNIIFASDDPVGAVQLSGMKDNLSRVGRFIENSNIALDRLHLMDATMEAINTVFIRAKELAVQASNDIYGVMDREAIAIEFDEMKSELMTLANTQDSTGTFIYAGFKTKTSPFKMNANGAIEYNGDRGVLNLQVTESRLIETSLDGSTVFQDIVTSEGVSTDLFAALDNISRSIRTAAGGVEEARANGIAKISLTNADPGTYSFKITSGDKSSDFSLDITGDDLSDVASAINTANLNLEATAREDGFLRIVDSSGGNIKLQMSAVTAFVTSFSDGDNVSTTVAATLTQRGSIVLTSEDGGVIKLTDNTVANSGLAKLGLEGQSEEAVAGSGGVNVSTIGGATAALANIDEAITIIELMFSFEQKVFPQFLLKFSNFFNVEFSYLAFLSTGQDTVNYLLILVFAFLATYFLPNYANKINELKLNWKFSLFISLIFIISLTILDRPQSFIYFEF